MNTQVIKNKLDKYMETATPEQVVKEFEDLGVEFVNSDGPVEILTKYGAIPTDWRHCIQELEDYYNIEQQKVNTNKMNLTQQLQQTSKWKEFEEWYNNQLYTLSLNGYATTKHELGFVDLPFSFKKGVFEKFIESKRQSYWQGESGTHYLTYPKVSCEEFNSFEELLIWYFNN